MKAVKCIWRLWNRREIRYLWFGGLTVCVNFMSFFLLTTYTDWNRNLNNGISIMLALLFAYVTNTWFVFRSRCGSAYERLMEFVRFFMARLFTMLLEFAGVYFLIFILDINAMVSKGILQVIIVLLNYVLSRFVIYRDFKKR